MRQSLTIPVPATPDRAALFWREKVHRIRSPIAGGGKGAAIGAGAGAGAGAVTQIATKGGAIKVPAETVLTFQLDKPVQIVEAK